MEHVDSEKLVGILANQATNSPIGAVKYFRNLVRKAGSSEKWREVSDIWEGDSERDARELITWSTNKTTLGSLLLCALLPSLGVDENAKFVIELIIRYNLCQDQGILIKFLIDNFRFQTVFDEDSITLLTQYIRNIIQDDINTNKIPDELIKKLILILIQLNNFDWVLQSCLATLDNFVQVVDENSQEKNIIKNTNINIIFRCFILFYFLLEKYPCQSDRFQRIVDFCTFLQNKIPGNDDSLKDWLKEITKSSGYQALRKSKSASIKNDLLEAYLMVIIRPVKPLSRRKFRVNGFLKIDEDFAQWIYPNYESGELTQQDNLFTLKEIEEYVAQLIYKTVELVLPEKTKLKCNDYSITIEFFLPCSHLCEQVDRWVIDLGEPIPIGKDYKVAVRSYERIASQIGEGNEVKQSSIYWGRLERKWQELIQIIEDNSLAEDIQLKQDRFECFVQGDCLNIRDLEYNLNQKIGIKLAFAPPKSKKEKEKLFGVFLRAGTPIAIWLRDNQIQGINLETETDKWIERQYLADLNLLLADIRTEREKAYFEKSILGDYLVIFCDNPTRKPTKPLSMSPSQPLPLAE